MKAKFRDWMYFLTAALLLFAIGSLANRLPSATASSPGSQDWPMWGGTPSRNMVSPMNGLPSEWDTKTKKNVKWVVDLGSLSYGTPVVSGGIVFIGTNNEVPRDPKEIGDRGVLMAFDASDGTFLWQATSEKLASGQVNDWPQQGICSNPMVEGDRLYYVTSRSEVVCLDTQGFRDEENDGPYKDEEGSGPTHADTVWVFDMMKEVGSFPHNMTASSAVGHGDLIFVSTSNGQDEEGKLPAPEAPTLIALNKNTGKLVWSDDSPGKNILHGQWSSPALGDIGGVTQVVMGQGDGWVRSYEPLTGKKLWEFDSNPKDAAWPETRNNIISTPVIYKDRVYIANGQDPEHGEGVGHLYCIDGTKRGDITESGLVWHYDKIRRSISTAAIHDGLLYLPDFSGFLHCLDAETGEVQYVHDTFAAVWGSPLVADGKVYLGDEDGDVVILKAGSRKEEVLAEVFMEGAIYGGVTPANGSLFVAIRHRLYALELKP